MGIKIARSGAEVNGNGSLAAGAAAASR